MNRVLLDCQVAKPDYSDIKIVIAMVGMPARGKSYLSNKLTRYLKVRTMGHPTIHHCGLSKMSRYLKVASLKVQRLELHSRCSTLGS